MTDLRTDRLVLHPLDLAEAGRVAAGTPGPGDRWADGYPIDGDQRAARNYLARHAEAGDPAPFGTYEIRLTDGTTIGGVGFHRPPDEDGAVEIGYGLVESARGHGYAAEALRALLELARSLGVRTVRGDADHDNIPSQRVMRAAGMHYVRSDEQVRYYELTMP
ncbi:MAG TPA: GNAT family N-acetyltransferase [Actinocatenispora sp.]